jgi:hypothetical protein
MRDCVVEIPEPNIAFLRVMQTLMNTTVLGVRPSLVRIRRRAPSYLDRTLTFMKDQSISTSAIISLETWQNEANVMRSTCEIVAEGLAKPFASNVI